MTNIRSVTTNTKYLFSHSKYQIFFLAIPNTKYTTLIPIQNAKNVQKTNYAIPMLKFGILDVVFGLSIWYLKVTFRLMKKRHSRGVLNDLRGWWKKCHSRRVPNDLLDVWILTSKGLFMSIYIEKKPPELYKSCTIFL